MSILILISTSINAQKTTLYKFKSIGEDKGLSSNWAYSIFQDDLGFIWVGTDDGLNRFDGYKYESFRPKNAEGNTLGNVQINSISKKRKGELWVATSNGLYTVKENKLLPFSGIPKSNYRDVLNENDSIAWLVGNTGFIKINTIKNTYNNLSEDINHTFYQKKGSKIFKDSSNNLWFGSNGVVYKFNPKNQYIEKFDDFENLDTNTKNDILAITQDKNGVIWVGFGQNGLYYKPNGSKKFLKNSDGVILNLHVDKDNQLWIGRGSNQGLQKIDLNNNNTSITFKYDIRDPNSISDNSIYCIFEDNAGDIWIGTFAGGVNYISKRSKKIHILDKNTPETPLKNNIVNEILEDGDFLWIGTEAGISRLNKKNNSIKYYNYDANDNKSLSRDPIHKIYKDSRDNIWVGTWDGGINLYNYEQDNFKRFPVSNKKGDLHSEHILAIAEDYKKRLWIGSAYGGLYQYDYEKNHFISFKDLAKNANTFPNDVTTIQETNTKELLLNTYISIVFLDPDENTYREFPINIDEVVITSSFLDSDNVLWIGTNTGLFQFDRKTEKYLPYNGKNYKINNLSIKAIIEDDNGIIWVSTNNGIFQINKTNKQITKYVKQDGFSANEFKREAAYKNKEGRLYFGTATGLTFFDPNTLDYNKKVPSLTITAFDVLYSKPNEYRKLHSITKNPNTEEKIELNSKQSSFLISYTGLNYLNPEKNKYRYKLEGYDKKWVDAGVTRSATYTNVNPGSYVFKVLGANNDNKWAAEPKTLKIVIHAPWYKTSIFKLFLGLLFLIILISIYLMRMAFYKKQRRVLQQQVDYRTKELTAANNLLVEKTAEIEEQNVHLFQHQNHLEELVRGRTEALNKAKLKAEESDRLKSAFMANVSHEIRTPMNAIYGFSNLLNEKNITEEEHKEYIEIINNNCNDLLLLIDDIMDMSILDSQDLKLNIREIKIQELLSSLEKKYKVKQTKALKLSFIYSNSTKEETIYTDSVRLKQILSNLLNNAFKFTEEGTITLGYTFSDNKDKITFFVKDTGIGITQNNLKTIFNPFRKAYNGSEKKYRGTGIGLSISQKLVKAFKGEITVKSKTGEGSTFFVEIPTRF